MKTLTNRDILINVGNAYFARGDAYYKKGYVRSLVVERENDGIIELRSSVKGSGNNLYDQTIIIDLTARHTDIEGDCSCPVNYNCKHVAAACIQYEADGASISNTNAQCLSWIDEFNKAGDKTTASGTNGDFLVYLLSPSKQAGKLEVEFRISHYLKMVIWVRLVIPISITSPITTLQQLMFKPLIRKSAT